MILPRRTVYLLLGVLAVGTVLFRYPLAAAHEMGSDTMFVHTLTLGILRDGRAVWYLNPLSLFGLYALSYPSAIPFVFSSVSSLANMPVEAAMLVFGWVVSLAGALGSFLVARMIRRDDVFALLIATVFSLSPYFVKDTFWVGSTRGFVVAMTPAFLILLIRSVRTFLLQDMAVALTLFVVMMAIHRMGFLAFFLIVSYLFAMPFYKVVQRLRFNLVRHERTVRYGLSTAGILAFAAVLYAEYAEPGITGANFIEQYRSGAFLQGDSFPILVLNMAISLTGKVGPAFPLILIGIPAYVWHRPKEPVDMFVLTTIFVFMPLLAMRDYMAEFLIPVFAVLIVIGLFWIRDRFPSRRKVIASALIILLAGSVAGSWEMKDYWSNQYATDAQIPEETYGAAIYLRHSTSGVLVGNDGLLAGQLAAISGRPVLPVGGASQHWTSPQQLMWGFVSPDAVLVRLMPLANISFNTDEIYLPVNVRNAEVDWETMLYYREPAQAEAALEMYGVHYVVVERSRPNSFLSYAHDRSSSYLGYTLPTTSYITYQDLSVSVWYRG